MPPDGMRTQRGRLRPATTRVTPSSRNPGTLSHLSINVGLTQCTPTIWIHLGRVSTSHLTAIYVNIGDYQPSIMLNAIKPLDYRPVMLNSHLTAIHVNIGDG